ncbi:MAG: ISAs1 family transposase, partial [Paracoccaceae bacterium]
MEEFSQLFEGVNDPRRSNAKRHDLHEMLMIALLSVLCGGEGCHDMSLFGRSKEAFLRRFMTLNHGIPSHDAFSDLFNALDPKSFQPVMQRLLADFARNLGGGYDPVIAIDGKALRRSFDKASGKSPLHLVQDLVQAFAAEARLVLGQVAVDQKSNEITAIPELLALLDVKGRIITADAMHTQRATSKAVCARGGDYVLALKGNQGTLFRFESDCPVPESVHFIGLEFIHHLTFEPDRVIRGLGLGMIKIRHHQKRFLSAFALSITLLTANFVAFPNT